MKTKFKCVHADRGGVCFRECKMEIQDPSVAPNKCVIDGVDCPWEQIKEHDCAIDPDNFCSYCRGTGMTHGRRCEVCLGTGKDHQ
jgi:hypothetical protein